jgi:hypothetical protein
MDQTICPACHVTVKTTDYYCYNCGRNLHPAPPKTGIGDQILLYIGSLILPPMGIIWGIKYLIQPNTKSKLIGITAICLTVIILYLAVTWSITLINTVNSQVNTQIQNIQGL